LTGRPTAPRNIAQLDRRQPVVQLAWAESQATSSAAIDSRTVTVRVDVKEVPADRWHTSGSGARDLRLFRNGSLVKVWHGDVLQTSPGYVQLDAPVPLVAGENRFTAYAFNRDNIKSADATLTLIGAESLRHAGMPYILAVGINEYAHRALHLRYAVHDAEAFAAGVAQEQSKLGAFQRVGISPLLNAQATKANILQALERFAGRQVALAAQHPFAKIKPAQPEDVVIIYFASHGKAQQDRFMLSRTTSACQIHWSNWMRQYSRPSCSTASQTWNWNTLLNILMQGISS